MIQRCFILIDGSNFYYKLKDLGYHNLLNLNFSKLASLLANGHRIVKSRYYVGRIRQHLCDRIILVSSDTDLTPAIRKVQEKGKIVEYVGFSHKPSMAMISRCLKSRILNPRDIASIISPHTS